MQRLMLTRASTFTAFKNVFYDIGAPVDRELEKCNLPIDMDLRTDLYIPVFKGLEFVEAMDCKEHIDDIVLRAFARGQHGRRGRNASLKADGAPSLLAELRRFLKLGHRVNPSVKLSIVRKPNKLEIECRFPAELKNDALHIMEWTIILQLLSVIRKSLGSDFYPTEVGFQVPFTLCQDASNMMPNARILFGRPKTSLAMSDEVLSWSVRGAGQHRRSDDALHGTAKPSAPPVIDFPGSLRLAMRSYLSDGHPSINIAAGIIGVSARTLQRRLAEDGQTYSAMIQQARFEVASELLEQPELKIIDVAYAAGYEDPSHFSRAFRRIAGVSPREYRQHIHALA